MRTTVGKSTSKSGRSKIRTEKNTAKLNESLYQRGEVQFLSEHDAADDQNYDALNFSRSLAGEFHDDINFALDKRGKSTNTLRT